MHALQLHDGVLNCCISAGLPHATAREQARDPVIALKKGESIDLSV